MSLCEDILLMNFNIWMKERTEHNLMNIESNTNFSRHFNKTEEKHLAQL